MSGCGHAHVVGSLSRGSCSRASSRPLTGGQWGHLLPVVGDAGGIPSCVRPGRPRLREHLQLEPVEYPTTRKIGATPWKGVAEIHAAFADPQIMAIMAISGGDDLIKVLRGLDSVVLRANPKAFFGYSDNTNCSSICGTSGSWASTEDRQWCSWRVCRVRPAPRDVRGDARRRRPLRVYGRTRHAGTVRCRGGGTPMDQL